MTNIDPLLERNRLFAATDARRHLPPLPFIPRQHSFVITCSDPRTDPADFLGLELGDAIPEFMASAIRRRGKAHCLALARGDWPG